MVVLNFSFFFNGSFFSLEDSNDPTTKTHQVKPDVGCKKLILFILMRGGGFL